MLGQLSAGVAHEINTPTGAILNVAADAQEHLRKLVLLEMGTAELPDETRRWLLERVPEILSERPTASEASVRAKRREIEQEIALPPGKEVLGLTDRDIDGRAGRGHRLQLGPELTPGSLH